jgi:NADP-dependent 3-hydroxy acid dehydrogenase YdfG
MSQKTLVLAGPGEHFGTEVARRFVKAGFAVALLARDTARLDRIAHDLKGLGGTVVLQATDFSDPASVKQSVQECSTRLPPWECCIYNAKSSPRGNISELNSAELKDSLLVNVVGAYTLAQLLIQDWDRAESSSLIITGGGYKDRPASDKLALSVGKGAAHSLALSLAAATSSLGVQTKEIIIDGIVRPEGPLRSSDLADYYLHVHKDRSDNVVYNFPVG